MYIQSFIAGKSKCTA